VNWLSLVAAALATLRALIAYLHDRKTIDAATAQALLKSHQEALDAIANAQAARELVRAAIARDPARLLQDDGFKRPD
jgi:hypothetical protein